MLLLWQLCFLVFNSLQAVRAQFIEPPKPDGSRQYRLGETVTLRWDGTDSYNILSLGIYQPDVNVTISWLISDTVDRPKKISWTVVDYGFDLTRSNLFQFLIVNGTRFGAPIDSPKFSIVNATDDTSDTTTTSSSIMPSSTTASPPVTSTSDSEADNRSDRGLGAGPAAGIGVGVTAAVGAVIAAGWWLFRRRRRAAQANLAAEPLSREYMQYAVKPTAATPPQMLDSQTIVPAELQGSDDRLRGR
ncbi:hypothetical protein D8B26_007433 [Coccidioides posadasii str. Silveira]|uniref:Uncharacterized protein n=1 Tax=Coccidioides posadasii (strain RMSCC 757 / Silveira) TaxID=443226 RepID=E9CV29_COCPS|nr:hypothetical protein CPSG_01377 [Coccidioides posadasii str. Silveira]QVM12816.1 hypothetical protein D8B26_007433 [Coccidioides posadasii str. Silveira]